MKSYIKLLFAKFLNFQICLSLLASFCVLLSLIPSSSFAVVYTYTANQADYPYEGWETRQKWTDTGRWDTYPGSTIQAGDEVHIHGTMLQYRNY
jgi:hypothetical protein